MRYHRIGYGIFFVVQVANPPGHVHSFEQSLVVEKAETKLWARIK